jgi:hypothetical protein
MDILGDTAQSDVLLVAMNIIQVMVLAYVGREQCKSSAERARRSDTDRADSAPSD